MKRKVYKALDAELDLFGIKQSFLLPFIVAILAVLLLSVVVGGLLSRDYAGVVFFLVSGFLVYSAFIALQEKHSMSDLYRKRASISLPDYIRIRRQFRHCPTSFVNNENEKENN